MAGYAIFVYFDFLVISGFTLRGGWFNFFWFNLFLFFHFHTISANRPRVVGYATQVNFHFRVISVSMLGCGWFPKLSYS